MLNILNLRNSINLSYGYELSIVHEIDFMHLNESNFRVMLVLADEPCFQVMNEEIFDDVHELKRFMRLIEKRERWHFVQDGDSMQDVADKVCDKADLARGWNGRD